MKKENQTWQNMKKRCYDKKYHNMRPTYKDCNLCEEWKCFTNFKEWYNKNYYKVDNERMCLDKDILIKGNKLYSPNTCIFVPARINSLFTKTNKKRGNLPIGVYSYKSKFKVQCNNKNGKRTFLGYYNTKEEAFNAYKEFKENVIKQIANEYKEKIPERLYNAMYNYKVEITD